MRPGWGRCRRGGWWPWGRLVGDVSTAGRYGCSLVLLLAVAAGACGGNDDATDPATTTERSTTTTAAAEASVDCADNNLSVDERRDAGCSLQEVLEAGPPDPSGATSTSGDDAEAIVPPAAATSLAPPCGRAIQLLAEADPDAEEAEVAASLEEDFGGMDRVEQQDTCGTIVSDLCEGPTSETFDRPLEGCG